MSEYPGDQRAAYELERQRIENRNMENFGEPTPSGHADALPDDIRLVAPADTPRSPEKRLSRDGDVRASATPSANPELHASPGDSTEGAGEALVTRCASGVDALAHAVTESWRAWLSDGGRCCCARCVRDAKGVGGL